MNKSVWWQRSVTALFLVAAPSPNVRAEVVYRETFGRPAPATGTNIGTQVFSWARFNAAGTAASNTSGINGGGTGAAPQNGRPTDVANVNAGNNSDGTMVAYPLGWQFVDGTVRLTYTPEYSFDPTGGRYEFSWYQGNAALGQGFRVAIQQGGTWYASNSLFDNSATNTADTFQTNSELKKFVYSRFASDWLLLNFTGTYDGLNPGTTMTSSALSLGAAPGADLSGMITAFGLYRNVTGSNGRFDSFTIDRTVLGDTNSNGVGGEYPADFDPIKDNFRKSPRTLAEGDLDGNGIVNFADFRQWKEAAAASGTSLDGIDFGSMFGAVPEPGTGLTSLMAWAAIVVLNSRRRCAAGNMKE